jgi:DNA-binding MarR family transcriptional regulator
MLAMQETSDWLIWLMELARRIRGYNFAPAYRTLRKLDHMDSISYADTGGARRRRRLNAEIRDSLREVIIQLSLLNRQVGAHLDLKDSDLDCINLIERHGPLSPRVLAQRAGLHPATMTGVLDRLERGGWVARDRDPSDRRAVAVRAVGDRNAELMRLYSGMNTSVSQICAGYQETELKRLADFLRRIANAGRNATDELMRPAPDRRVSDRR